MSKNADSRYTKWKAVIEDAVQLAEQFPERYRVEILKALLRRESDISIQGKPEAAAASGGPAQSPARGGIAAIAYAAGVPAESLQRIFDIDEENEEVHVLVPRVGGDTKSERQNRFSILYCLAREKAFGETKTDIEKLRNLCDDRGCYDSSNFTKNFRNQDLLREIPGDDGESRRYLLSEDGVEKAKELLRTLVNSD